MRLVTVATHSERYFPILIESCRRHNADLDVLGWGKKWGGFAWRFALMKEYLSALPPNEIVCFIDAYDVILLKPLDILESRFKRMGYPIVIASDGSNFSWYTKLLTKWMFGECKNVNVNGGSYIGYASELLDMITEFSRTYNLHDKHLDDQKMLTQYCIRHNIYIDTKYDLFLNYNSYVPEKSTSYLNHSCIFHSPGNYNIDNILLKLGYDPSQIDHKYAEYYMQFIKHHIIFLLMMILAIVLFIYLVLYGIRTIRRR